MAVLADQGRIHSLEPRQHVVSIVVGPREIDGWLEYQIDNSLVEPADSFVLRRPFDINAWNALPLDERVTILIDGVPRISGFIDSRRKSAETAEMEVAGRCRVGRLVQESAPRVTYGGRDFLSIIKELASPWFERVVTSNARNRRVMVGKGGRPAVGKEPIVLKGSVKHGRINPGQVRWEIIEQLVSAEGCAAWSSADGKELIVDQPNADQGVSCIVRHAAESSRNHSTCLDLVVEESIADSYAKILAFGSGATSPDDYGANVVSRGGLWIDNPANRADGTGLRFRYPKLLIVPEQTFKSNDEAIAIANREAARRDFRSDHIVATMPFHGVDMIGGTRALFAPDTIARVQDEEIELDEDYLIYAVSAKCSRSSGEVTTLSMVPRNTRIVL